jgi:hypothetical protein
VLRIGARSESAKDKEANHAGQKVDTTKTNGNNLAHQEGH